MATIVCIETSTTNCSVALSVDGKVKALRELNNGYSHAENITLFIDSVLVEGGVSYQAIDAVAVSKGPGSYTGLRIGVSAAKGICMATGKPLISIDTLYAMAFQAKLDTGEAEISFCPMIDARRMEVYCALYSNALEELLHVNALVIHSESFKDHLEKGKVMFFGDGALKCRSEILHRNAVFIGDVYPSAAAMCKLADDKYHEQSFEVMETFEPFYLKDFIAGKGSVLPSGS